MNGPAALQYVNRSYRQRVDASELTSFQVTVMETDLWVHAPKALETVTRELIIQYRGFLSTHIDRCPDFLHSLVPVEIREPAPNIVRQMAAAGRAAGVGPMAAVAGAIAEHVGRDLLAYTDQVIVENGGDIFLKTKRPATVAIFAGASPLSMKIGIIIHSQDDPMAVCTSSGTVGHSLSFGRADAVCVVARQGALADAMATAVGNRVKSAADIQGAIDFARTVSGVVGVAVVVAKRIGLWGEIEVVPLELKKC